MDLAVSIYVHSIEKVSNLLGILKVRRKELLDVFECNETIIVTVNFEKNFPEFFCILLVDLTAISNNILDALSK
jgi:hypothetical protein